MARYLLDRGNVRSRIQRVPDERVPQVVGGECRQPRLARVSLIYSTV